MKKQSIIKKLLATTVVTMLAATIFSYTSRDVQAEEVKEIYTMVYGGHSYRYISQAMSFADANEYCKKYGGHMVTISSKKENDKI